jgi:hypothetical protein
MTLLLFEFCCCPRKKQERAEKRAGASLAKGVRLYASRARLTNRATSLQPTATPQKQHKKSQQKERSQQLVSHVTFPPNPGLGLENINILMCIFFGWKVWKQTLPTDMPDTK